MAHRVLGHGAGPAGQAGEQRRFLHAHDVAQLVAHDLDQGFVGLPTAPMKQRSTARWSGTR